MNLVRESISFQRYKDPKKALFGSLVSRIEEVKMKMKIWAKENSKRLLIDDDEDEDFQAGIKHNGCYFGIGVNEDTTLPFEAITEDKFHDVDAQETETVEEAIELLDIWMSYTNYK